ncbi:hypothetical protein [Halomarina oriensis]|nr:hypothetical protein [Halomarina oriensis]
MGLKSGSRDAGLDDAEDPEGERAAETAQEESQPATDESPTNEQEATRSDTESASDSSRPSMSAIPYKLRRNKVNEGREQVPYFLREEVIDAESDLQESLEGMLGESVYKSDYREAAMVVAQRRPELVAEVLREWGYDLE